MRLPVRLLIGAGIVVVSVTLGLVAGVLAVAYVFPAPMLLGGTSREGTPVQIVAFVGAFGIVTIAGLILGLNLLARWARPDGSAKANRDA